MSGNGRPDEHLAGRHVFGRVVTGTVSMLDRTPARPAVTQKDVPPRIDLIIGRERNVVEDKARRLARDHSEVGQVGVRVADQKVVDVVLACVTPVANDAHAVGDSGECVVPSRGCRRRASTASACSAADLRPSTAGRAAGPCRRSRGSRASVGTSAAGGCGRRRARPRKRRPDRIQDASRVQRR